MLLFIFPAFLFIAYSVIYSYDVIYYDLWSEVATLQKIKAGQFSLTDFFSLHNEHRLFVPQLFNFIINYFTGMNYRVLSFLYAVIFLPMILVIYLVLKKQFVFKSFPLVLVPVSFILLSLKQWEAVFYPDTARAWSLLFSILSFYFLCFFDVFKSGKTPFALSIIFAVAGSFSFGTNLAVWLCGIPVILAIYEKRKISCLLIWLAAAAAVFILYFHDFRKSDDQVGIMYLVTHMGDSAKYAVIYLGNTFFNGAVTRIIWGTVLISFLIMVIYFFISDKRNWKNKAVLFWMTLIGYNIFVMLMTLVARINFGSKQAGSPRYVSSSIMIVTAVYVLILYWRNIQIIPSARRLFACLFLICVAGIFASFSYGLNYGRKNLVIKEKYAEIIYNYRSATKKDLEEIHPDVENIRSWIEFAEANKLSLFRNR
jgi:hypothetical protein